MPEWVPIQYIWHAIFLRVQMTCRIPLKFTFIILFLVKFLTIYLQKKYNLYVIRYFTHLQIIMVFFLEHAGELPIFVLRENANHFVTISHLQLSSVFILIDLSIILASIAFWHLQIACTNHACTRIIYISTFPPKRTWNLNNLCYYILLAYNYLFHLFVQKFIIRFLFIGVHEVIIG